MVLLILMALQEFEQQFFYFVNRFVPFECLLATKLLAVHYGEKELPNLQKDRLHEIKSFMITVFEWEMSN